MTWNISTIFAIGKSTASFQARRLHECEFAIESIDVAASLKCGNMEYQVKEYDGQHIPCDDNSFDIVFSSNVLEHVLDLRALEREVRRVLRPNGYCIHVIPTVAWRFWTIVAHYVEFLSRLSIDMRLREANGERSWRRWAVRNVWRTLSLIAHYAVVPRHGEFGTAFTELYTFSRYFWRRRFHCAGFSVEADMPLGLFYTGHMVLGRRLSLKTRARMASVLGSACMIYVLRPLPQHGIGSSPARA
jgi:SAM-dependent methyltransferase